MGLSRVRNNNAENKSSEKTDHHKDDIEVGLCRDLDTNIYLSHFAFYLPLHLLHAVLYVPRFPIDYSDQKPLGKTGEKIVAIGVGTWAIRDYRAAEEALVYAVELGLNVIDTAEMYAQGLAEELVGRVAKKVGRDRVFIITKLLPYRFTDPETAVKAAEQSAKRLGVSYVDLILIHWPSDVVPIHTQIWALEAIAERGLTRYIGVSNFKKSELKEAIESVKKYEIVLNQVKYSVLDKKVERDLLPFCIENGVTLQAYTPIERGAVNTVPQLIQLAAKYGKTPVQIALNYLISRPRVVAIPKSERKERIKEFSEAMGWRLSPEDIDFLEKL